MLEVVTLKEIDAIFAVTDALGIHREMLVILLGPASPGRVRRLPSGKLEIIVDAARPIEEWVKELPKLIAAAQGTGPERRPQARAGARSDGRHLLLQREGRAVRHPGHGPPVRPPDAAPAAGAHPALLEPARGPRPARAPRRA